MVFGVIVCAARFGSTIKTLNALFFYEIVLMYLQELK